MSDLAPLLQGFFTDKLIRQRQASPHTIAAYRDAFTLLLGFAADRTGRHPARMSLADLDAATIGDFLTHLETVRGNSISTRNTRLAAVHSFFALRRPTSARTQPRRSSGSWRSHRNGATTPSSPTSTTPRSTPSWPPRTARPGSGDATTPCYWSPSTPGYGSRS